LPSPGEGRGKLYVVGTGPGPLDQMTGRAQAAIRASEYVLGNRTYLQAIRPLLAGKRVRESSMGKEVERAKEAVELAASHIVSIVSGGDPGVYGMAGIVLEVLERSGLAVPVEVVPGVTAATAAASLAGSPLSGDFAVISPSDLLTPWEVIEARLDAAFGMGVPVVLYNPRSRGRPGNFGRAMAIARRHLPGETPVAVVKNAFRDGEECLFAPLAGIGALEDRVDMHSTVIVGGEESRFWMGKDDVRGIITPRGYHRKYLY
jgi:precorrin-3B C17-methyltransferase / cobalt-factor III methyltransferase